MLPNVVVDVSFDVTNKGHEPTGTFWIAAFLGQTRPILQLDRAVADDRGLPHVQDLKRGKTLHLSGTVLVPRTNTDLLMSIVAGCPPGSEPCVIPEIAFENNEATGSIPLPPEPTPPPTPTPVIIY